MNFAVYVPPQAEKEKVPVLYWLSGNSTYGEMLIQSSTGNFILNVIITYDFTWFQAWHVLNKTSSQRLEHNARHLNWVFWLWLLTQVLVGFLNSDKKINHVYANIAWQFSVRSLSYKHLKSSLTIMKRALVQKR